jgi:hypothetical protein
VGTVHDMTILLEKEKYLVILLDRVWMAKYRGSRLGGIPRREALLLCSSWVKGTLGLVGSSPMISMSCESERRPSTRGPGSCAFQAFSQVPRFTILALLAVPGLSPDATRLRLPTFVCNLLLYCQSSTLRQVTKSSCAVDYILHTPYSILPIQYGIST